MFDPIISIEHFSEELLVAYQASGMERAKLGPQAIKWAFSGNTAPFAVARHEGNIVGISSYVQNRMQFDRTEGIAVQAVDSFVFKTMRGRGLFTRLACAYDDHARRSKIDLVWGFPNDNAAPTWYGKLRWHRHGQVPFLIKPLRIGYFARKIGLPIDFPLTLATDQRIDAIRECGDWGDELWARVAPKIGVATIRNRAYLQHRLFDIPSKHSYRVVAETSHIDPAIVATHEANKHGGRIAYLMEALGDAPLQPLLMSEMGRLASRGVELVFAWSFPWSPNYRVLRKAGFIPFPEKLRPIRIWFGTSPKSAPAVRANESVWYLSYLDSDTV